MDSIWSTQLDYVFFLYGLAFLLLGAVGLAIREQGPRPLPWVLLGLFGCLHGASEWADMAALLLHPDDPAWEAPLRLALMTASFAVLAEFGRRGLSGDDRLRLGGWVVAAVPLVVAATAVAVDMATANSLARYLLAIPGCLATAVVLAGHSARVGGGHGGWLRVVAVVFVLYGVVAGAVVPLSALPPSHWLNTGIVFANLGVPAQVLRGALAVAAAAALWCYELERAAAAEQRRKLRQHFGLTLVVLLLLEGLGGVLTNRLGEMFDGELKEDVATDLSLLTNTLAEQQRATDGAAEVLGELGGIGGGADLLVERLHRASGGGRAMLLDRTGTVVVASAAEGPSLVGKNYDFRPYFRQAMAGMSGHYFGVGLTMGRPGYYSSFPIGDHGQVTGVAVVKRTLSAASLGLTAIGDAFLIDADGMVLLAGRPDLQLRPLWPLSEAQRRGVEENRQFSGADFRPVLAAEPADGAWLKRDGAVWLVGRRPVGSDGWSIVLMRKQEMAGVDRLFGIVTTLLISLLVIAHYLIVKRQLNAEAVLGEQRNRLELLSRTLDEARSRAEAATRAKSDFLANMSHEIRTPMNAVIGLSQLALRTVLDAKQHDYLTKIRASATALLGIINDILDFSRVEAGRMTLEAVPFNLSSVLDTVANGTATRAGEKGLDLLFRVEPEVPLGLVGDPLRLGQVLLNLVGNAVKFTERGEVLLTVRVVGLVGDKIELAFDVRDTGIGMNSEEMARLFRPFSQADTSTTRRFGGSGLGLAISSQLVALMDGTITVDSTPGTGSVFTFTVVLGVQAVDAGGPVAAPAARFRSLRALVVDDNATAREILSSTLLGWSMAVRSAASGREALCILEEAAARGEAFDLALLDWQMPGFDGLETAGAIRSDSRIPKPPVLFMVTAYEREDVASRAEALGIRTLLIKPVSPSILHDAIAAAFGTGERGAVCRPAPPPLRLRGTRVLLAEDNEINRQVAIELLAQAGVTVDVATNGREAVAMVLDGATAYDAVLMDIQMPEMDGFEATRLIRARFGPDRLPIIAMTAHAFDQERRRCLEAGMDDHIAKPVDPAKLLDTLALRLRLRPLAVDASAGEELPDDLPPFDIAAALPRVLGKRSLLRKLIVKFHQTYASAGTDLDRFVATGGWGELKSFVHTLKSVSGTLEAANLFHLAEEVETALHEGRTEAAVALLPRLRAELDLALATAATLTGG